MHENLVHQKNAKSNQNKSKATQFTKTEMLFVIINLIGPFLSTKFLGVNRLRQHILPSVHVTPIYHPYIKSLKFIFQVFRRTVFFSKTPFHLLENSPAGKISEIVTAAVDSNFLLCQMKWYFGLHIGGCVTYYYSFLTMMSMDNTNNILQKHPHTIC